MGGPKIAKLIKLKSVKSSKVRRSSLGNWEPPFFTICDFHHLPMT